MSEPRGTMCGCGRFLVPVLRDGRQIGVTHTEEDDEHHVAYFAGMTVVDSRPGESPAKSQESENTNDTDRQHPPKDFGYGDRTARCSAGRVVFWSAGAAYHMGTGARCHHV